jgi:hypothetical protein
MPQVLNSNTMPEFKNGYVCSGRLKTNVSGLCTLRFSGRISQGNIITIATAIDDSFGYIVNTSTPTYNGSTKTTDIVFTVRDSDGTLVSDDKLVDYFCWIAYSQFDFVPVTVGLVPDTELITLK